MGHLLKTKTSGFIWAAKRQRTDFTALEVVKAKGRISDDQYDLLEAVLEWPQASYRHHAVRLGIAFGTVKSRLNRGRTALSKLLKDGPV